MSDVGQSLSKNRTRLIMIFILGFLFVMALQGMETQDWAITIMRGLSVGAIVFLVAAGLSLIFGLMDVLNLAHGEMFMIGAYIGWTVYVRPDTFVDILPPVALFVVGFVLMPIWRALLARVKIPAGLARIWPWVALILALGLLWLTASQYSIAIWDPEVYTESPITNAVAMDMGVPYMPDSPEITTIAAAIALTGALFGGILLSLGVVGLQERGQRGVTPTQFNKRPIIIAIILILIGLGAYLANDWLTTTLITMSTTWRFFVAMGIAAIAGVMLGGLIETVMIRPLYDRPIYQIMITLGVSFIIIEMVRSLWGRPEFTMPKPEFFAGSGDGCPATSIGGWLENQCSTILLFDGRIRTYNEIFIIIVGVVVLLAIWLLLQRTRIGMIIRAGVQDSEMVEALGINVRAVFTLVFGLGVGLAAMGGVLAAPSMGLSSAMGTRLLLLALIALAIGGLTSFPGAAAGALLVGLMQQFMIKYGQIGINIPFLEEPFKPSPPLVPASVVLLMVVVLLVLPQGLFGRRE